MDLRGKRVVLSGGSSGIGKEAAILLARQGCDVAIVARDAARLEAARAEIAAAAAPGRKVIAVSADVTSDESVDAAAREVLATLGGVDVLVANQGYARCAPITEQSMDEVRALLDTNFLGHVRLVKAFAPAMKAQRSGTVCLVASMLGFMGFYGYGAYAASKFAIAGFGEALRQELLPHGVQVNVFYPPTTDTPGLEAENETKPALTGAIEGSSRTFTAVQVAQAMLDGISSRAFVSMVGLDSWAIYWLSRFAPRLVRWVIDRELWAFVRKQGVPS
jgi:NAD(P)-dependent dehydrogenase (short-subunit alcohol dehydrogenase family)